MAALATTAHRTLIWDGVAAMPTSGPTDLTGCTVYVTIKQSVGDADSAALAALSSPSGGVVITSTTNRTFVVTVPLTTFDAITRVTVVYYEVVVKDGSGNDWQADSGTITVSPRLLGTVP